jgi:hypothetical protein
MALIGFQSAIVPSHSGMPPVGTNVFATNVSGKITRNTIACAASAARTIRPSSVPTQLIA